MKIQYFTKCENLQELKQLYYKLALKHHPDRDGGSVEVMQIINNEYEYLSKNLIFDNVEFSDNRKTYETQAATDILEKINLIVNIAGLNIEIIGSWLWITGNTYANRDYLKENGFIFSRPKSAWYFHSGNFRKTSKKNFSIDDLRYTFGSEKVEKERTSNALQ